MVKLSCCCLEQYVYTKKLWGSLLLVMAGTGVIEAASLVYSEPLHCERRKRALSRREILWVWISLKKMIISSRIEYWKAIHYQRLRAPCVAPWVRRRLVSEPSLCGTSAESPQSSEQSGSDRPIRRRRQFRLINQKPGTVFNIDLEMSTWT